MERPTIGRNVMVVGSPGSGKSTLAREIAGRFGHRLIHMDRIYWTAGWRLRPALDQLRMVEAAIDADGWIFDGNHTTSVQIRAKRADTLIWLDLPRSLCIARVLKRVATGYGRVRQDMAEGCPERLDIGFLRWVWTFPRHSRPGLERLFDGFPRQKVQLTSAAAVAAYLAEVQGQQEAVRSAQPCAAAECRTRGEGSSSPPLQR
ncbi:hypothetical protein [Jiella sp. M17.18]|uniref:hypothetical protein n=1 Tax=Jiella sp. M17.18 TaxID=3234247 RepID=UPI0034DEBDF5